jgi:hypothetical protein
MPAAAVVAEEGGRRMGRLASSYSGAFARPAQPIPVARSAFEEQIADHTMATFPARPVRRDGGGTSRDTVV